MRRCIMWWCQESPEDKKIKYHRFVKSRTAQWLKALGLNESELEPNSRICSKHFTPQSYKTVRGKKYLKDDAVPNTNLTPPLGAYTGTALGEDLAVGSPSVNVENIPTSMLLHHANECLQDVNHIIPMMAQNAASRYHHSSSMSHLIPIQPDVRFKPMPFYKQLAELLKPSSLVPSSNSKVQEKTFFFHLTPQQAIDIVMSKDCRSHEKHYQKQVHLRFCLQETTCEQDDYYPLNVFVLVNNKVCQLPVPVAKNANDKIKRRSGPLDITNLLKISPTVANTIAITWTIDYIRAYAVTVVLVQKVVSSDLLQTLKNKGIKQSDYTRGLIKEKLSDDGDSEIATTSLKVSLLCPLGKMRMSIPCRAITCSHLQCFDASLYLQMNERKPTWSCPVCDQPALYENLVIDGYFKEVLSSTLLPSEAHEIQLHKDGTWSCQQVATNAEALNMDSSNSCVEIVCDDEVTIVSETLATQKVKREKSKKVDVASYDVVDLTCSDDENDKPPAKRRAVDIVPDSTIDITDSISSVSDASEITEVQNPLSPISLDSSSSPASPEKVTNTSNDEETSMPRPDIYQILVDDMDSNTAFPEYF